MKDCSPDDPLLQQGPKGHCLQRERERERKREWIPMGKPKCLEKNSKHLASVQIPKLILYAFVCCL